MFNFVFISSILTVGLKFVSANTFGTVTWNRWGNQYGIQVNNDLTGPEKVVAEAFWRIYSTTRMPEKLIPGKNNAPMPPNILNHKVLAIFAFSLDGNDYQEVLTSFPGCALVYDRKPFIVWTDPTLQEAEAKANNIEDKVLDGLLTFQEKYKSKLARLSRVGGCYDFKKIGHKDDPTAHKLYVTVQVVGHY